MIMDDCSIIDLVNGVDTHTLRNIHQTWCIGDTDYNRFKNLLKQAQWIWQYIYMNIDQDTESVLIQCLDNRARKAWPKLEAIVLNIMRIL